MILLTTELTVTNLIDYYHIPELNFTNILCTAFTLPDPESVKIQLSHQYLFTLLRSAGVKAVRRKLMKLTPGVI